MAKRSILLLGGSEQQVVAIETAKRLGFRTVLCDYLEDNPGQRVADAFYLVSTTDLDGVLDVARKEDVSGVLAYASDPAAATAAAVAEEFGLPGNPLCAVKTLAEKHLFRAFLQQNGFCVPKSVTFGVGVSPNVDGLRFPIVVKPTDASGSKGVSVVENAEGIAEAKTEAARFSRNQILIAEEYIESRLGFVIGGDVFVSDGLVKSWGLVECIRDMSGNSLVPVGKKYPLEIDEVLRERICVEIQKVLSAAGIRQGAVNVELIVGRDDQIYFLELGPRDGGNMIPLFLSAISGNNLVEASVLSAMGEPVQSIDFDGTAGGGWLLHVLHSNAGVIFERPRYPRKWRECLEYEHLYVLPGQFVPPFEGAQHAAGIAFFRLPTSCTAEDIEELNGSLDVGPR